MTLVFSVTDLDANYRPVHLLYGSSALRSTCVTNNLNILPGDITPILDYKSLNPQYWITLIKQVYLSSDNFVKKAPISYKNVCVCENATGTKACLKPTVRSVRRLALLLPIDHWDQWGGERREYFPWVTGTNRANIRRLHTIRVSVTSIKVAKSAIYKPVANPFGAHMSTPIA